MQFPRSALAAAVSLGLISVAYAQDGAFVAPVTVLKDDMVYNVAKDGSYSLDELVQLRINTAQAAQTLGQAQLSYSSSLGDVQVLEAYLIGKDGKRVDVAKDKIIDQQSPVSTGAPSYSDLKVKSIIFPAVEPGVVEVMHTLKQIRKPLFAGQFSIDEHFPNQYEVKDSKVTLRVPASLPVQLQVIGMDGGDDATAKSGFKQWTWTVHDLKAQVPEVGSVSTDDNAPRVVATSFPDWASVAKAYADGSDPKAKVTPAIQKQADEITQGITDPRARAVALYNFVARNIRYVSLTFGQGGVVPHDADSILSNRYGDCKDHVVLLQALLASKGIDSSPVLVNATNAYWMPTVALAPGVYNHCITYIPSLKMFVDSTADVAPFGLLSPALAGKTALVIRGDEGKAVQVRLPTTDVSRDTAKTTMSATLAADGTLSGKASYRDNGVFEVIDRLVLSHVQAGQEGQVAAALMGQFGVPGTGTLALGDARDLSKPYAFTSSFDAPGFANVPGPGSFAFPTGIPGMAGIVGFQRELMLPERKQPWICVAAHKVEDSTLTLPPGIKVKQLPTAVHFANAMGRYDATYTQAGNTITVERVMEMTPRGAVCDSADYQLLRAMGAQIARDLRAQVVY